MSDAIIPLSQGTGCVPALPTAFSRRMSPLTTHDSLLATGTVSSSAWVPSLPAAWSPSATSSQSAEPRTTMRSSPSPSVLLSPPSRQRRRFADPVRPPPETLDRHWPDGRRRYLVLDVVDDFAFELRRRLHVRFVVSLSLSSLASGLVADLPVTMPHAQIRRRWRLLRTSSRLAPTQRLVADQVFCPSSTPPAIRRRL